MVDLPRNGPTWTDVVLFAMGVFLVAGFLVGFASGVPVRITGGVGSLGAAATLVGGMAWNPSTAAVADRPSLDRD